MSSLSNRIRLVRFRPARVAKDRSVQSTPEAPHNLGDRWLSVDEIANYLGVKRDTVYKWIDRQNMPAHKVGRLWKFRRDQIDEWVLSKNARPRGSRPQFRGRRQHDETNVKGGT